MDSVKRGFLIRTILLISVVCGTSSVLSSWLFVDRTDVQLHMGLLAMSSLVAGLGAYYFVLRPMGKLAQAESDIRHVHFVDRFHAIIENMEEGVAIFGPDGVTEWNRSALKILGINEEQLQRSKPHSPGWKLTNENGHELNFEDRPTQQCLRAGIPISSIVGVHRNDLEMTWVRVHASPIFSSRTEEDRMLGRPPKINAVVTTYRDISAEREALQRFELAMKAVKLGVWDWDLGTGKIVWDDALSEMYGMGPSTFKSGYDIFNSAVVPEDRDRVRRTLELAIHECRDCSMEFKIRRADGAIRVIRSESHGFYSRGGKAMRHVGVNWDITEQREQELRVLQASKMSSLGEMSAGIAHEINNPLAIIIGKSEALRSVLDKPNFSTDTLFRHIDVIEKTANRIAKIVKSLRAFSRDGVADPFETTNVAEIVNEALALCHSRFLNNGIELTVSSVAEDLLIDARAVQISQVLLNLLNNAFDAVLPLEDKWVRVEVTSDARYIEFSVTDSGRGIPANVREKMVQPFFTTKEVGMGTGLGLSIVAGIVQAHSGTMIVDMDCPNTRIAVRIPKTQVGQVNPTAA